MPTAPCSPYTELRAAFTTTPQIGLRAAYLGHHLDSAAVHWSGTWSCTCGSYRSRRSSCRTAKSLTHDTLIHNVSAPEIDRRSHPGLHSMPPSPSRGLQRAAPADKQGFRRSASPSGKGAESPFLLGLLERGGDLLDALALELLKCPKTSKAFGLLTNLARRLATAEQGKT